MPGKRIVNASPLVFLAREDLLEMLRQGGFDVVVPEAVAEEIRAHGPADPTGLTIHRASGLATAPVTSILLEAVAQRRPRPRLAAETSSSSAWSESRPLSWYLTVTELARLPPALE